MLPDLPSKYLCVSSGMAPTWPPMLLFDVVAYMHMFWNVCIPQFPCSTVIYVLLLQPTGSQCCCGVHDYNPCHHPCWCDSCCCCLQWQSQRISSDGGQPELASHFHAAAAATAISEWKHGDHSAPHLHCSTFSKLTLHANNCDLPATCTTTSLKTLYLEEIYFFWKPVFVGFGMYDWIIGDWMLFKRKEKRGRECWGT